MQVFVISTGLDYFNEKLVRGVVMLASLVISGVVNKHFLVRISKKIQSLAKKNLAKPKVSHMRNFSL